MTDSDSGYTQWLQNEAGEYAATTRTTPLLAPGYYGLQRDMNNRLWYIPQATRSEKLISVPESPADKVMQGIYDFWDRQEIFQQFNLSFKRGILMHGPPGMGKSSTIQNIVRAVIAKDGVVFDYQTKLFNAAYERFRAIQPSTPLVVLMEDFETNIKDSGYESCVLNLLDGMSRLDNVVFLATTNYLEKLPARIVNRPSRFDLVIEIPCPDELLRARYLESLVTEGGMNLDDIDISRYIYDTDGMSMAHIKELFIATVILGQPYIDVVKRLRSLEPKKSIGFKTAVEPEEAEFTQPPLRSVGFNPR